MLVDNTVYRSEDGQRKQLTMAGWAGSALSENPHLSKGLTAYECLLLADDDFEDRLTQLESRVFDELRQEVGADIRPALREVVESNIVSARENLVDRCEYEDPFESVYPVNIYLIESVEKQLPDRGIGKVIEKAVAHTAASPWGSRFDRLADLQDILTYARNGDTPAGASEFVQEVVRGESSRYDVSPLNDLLEDREWYEAEDLTLDRLRQRSDDVPATPEARSTALENALRNSEDSYSREDIIDIAMEDRMFGCVRPTAKGYAERVDLGDSNVWEFPVMDKIEEIASGSRQRTNKPLKSEDWTVVGLKDSPEEWDGVYEDLQWEATEAIAKVRRLMKTGDGLPDFVDHNLDLLADWLDAKEAERQELLED